MQMKDEWGKKDNACRLFIKADLLKILAILNRFNTKKIDDYKELKLIKTNNNPINKVVEYIRFNFKEEITLEKLANVVNLNKTYLSTLFKKTINMSIPQYIKGIRLRYANYLVLNTKLNITQIAVHSGFKNISHFVKCYREKYSITPLSNRKQLKK